MSFEGILGQERAVARLRKALQSDRLSHAYLFHGRNGTGKKLAALQFTKALYCTAADACDACTTCHKIDGRNHPDVLLIEPEGASIRIEAIRMIQNRLSYKPYESQRTTIIIDGCELLSLPASHALLKTLEEPPGNALLLLLTGRKEALPLTIISRCQLLPFQPLAPQHIASILSQRGVDAETAKATASLVEGSLDAFAETEPAQIRCCPMRWAQGIPVFSARRDSLPAGGNSAKSCCDGLSFCAGTWWCLKSLRRHRFITRTCVRS